MKQIIGDIPPVNEDFLRTQVSVLREELIKLEKRHQLLQFKVDRLEHEVKFNDILRDGK